MILRNSSLKYKCYPKPCELISCSPEGIIFNSSSIFYDIYFHISKKHIYIVSSLFLIRALCIGFPL